MTAYQWLCLLGIPTLIISAITAACTYISAQNKRRKEEEKKRMEEILAIKLGLQAVLRAQMIAEFNKWEEKRYAPIYARQNFENCWDQYHSLGANGVMDDIHEKFLQLPTEQK